MIRSALLLAALAPLALAALAVLAACAACGGTSTGGTAARPPAPAPGGQPPAAPSAHHGGHHGGDPAAPHPGPHGAHHRFEDAEAWAKVFDDPARDARQQPERVLEALALAPELAVADIGAGTGYFAVRLARAVPRGQVIATDVEPGMVRYLTERARREGLSNLRAMETPPDSPRLARASVDRVLVVDVWHHLGDRAAYARQLAEALRPGGRIVVVDIKLDARRGPPREHRLAPEVILGELRAAGLTAEISAIDLPEQYIVIARR